ncbi:MAG: 5'-nucleotidase C-terminal domain-containing protein [Bacteroidetes bacterium]|nr:5'-nucleotidase C-terminal domain-containing protein [Bacteroidota bacterium]
MKIYTSAHGYFTISAGRMSSRNVIFNFCKRNIILLLCCCLSLSSCSYYYSDTGYEAKQLRVSENAQSDSAVLSIIQPYKSALDGEMNLIVGEMGVELKRAKPESTLGNFICDVILKEGQLYADEQIDFAVYNYGGIRQEFINAGPITKGKIFELLPFENFGAIVTLDGNSTAKLIQKIIDEGGWPVSGIKITVKNNVAENVLINNVPFDTNKNYTVIMNDYMANGGDKMDFLFGQKINILGITIRDMVLNYISRENGEGRKLYAKIEGRITYAE